LEREFEKFGDIRNLKLKKGYAFIEYSNRSEAKEAIRELDGKKLFGQQQRIVVEKAKGSRRERERERRRERDRDKRRNYRRSRSRSQSRSRNRSRGRDREKDYYYNKRTGPKKSDICFNCGNRGHWANECPYTRKER
jgi:RNA recognition motif-containing protein